MAEMKPLILVTGANGFVGRHLCKALLERGWSVRGAVRHTDGLIPGVEPVIVEIGPKTEWEKILSEVNCVIHLAAKIHDMTDSARTEITSESTPKPPNSWPVRPANL